jgi:integrase
MPYADVPAFFADITAKLPTNGRTALLFQILTAARPGEVRAARWGQIDFVKRNWNRPAEMMKGVHAPPHTVTLNEAAVELLKRLQGDRLPPLGDLIFPGQRAAMLSDMTLNKIIRAAGLPYDTHAFRSSFRDWAAEKMPDIPDPVAEAAIAHAVPDKVVRAYKRTNFLDMRRTLLQAWGSFVVSAMVVT